MKKTAVITVLLMIAGTSVFAQVAQTNNRQVVRFQERRGVTLSGGLQVAVPTGEFAENYGRLPFGINAFISVPLLNAPIEIGGGFAWNHMARSKADVFINNPEGGRNAGTLRINGNSYTYQIHGRLRPFNGRFRPYGEVFVGARNFSTTSKLQSSSGVQPSTERLDRNFTFIAGWGVGAKYEVTPGVFIEARFESSVGSKTEYIDPESITIDDQASFDFRNLESRTDQWALSVGVAFAF
ncbi:MAG: outer membrane beta-barrel protein [Cryomorphaceae bacterium]|nr:porin family protein [Flavobacteriales bacterium]